MSLTERSSRRSLPVTLRQVPESVRFSAFRREAERAGEEERLDLLAAAVWPSDRVYFVAESARPMVERWAA